ncbi:uncharacterized protein LOC142632629 [Castanea sativa]|uniref:uncharacterized protein LOC142632629 n=1 Tax=Castanea sativa TaxID=21020 RepID=UPI003F652DDF
MYVTMLIVVLMNLFVGKIVAASLKSLSEMESASVPSNEHASTTGSNANSSSVRAKCDPAWDHVTEELKDGKSSYRCIHCGKSYKGGGINRMKRHLAGIKGDVAACMGVPYDVRFQMVENLKEIAKSKEQTKKDQEASNYSPLEDSPEFEDVQEITPRGRGLSRGNRSGGPSNFPLRSYLGKRKVGDIGNYFAPRTTPGAQPSIRSVLAGKEKKLRVDMAVARWMYDACIPINAVNSSYYQPMLNAVASYGPRYRGPNYHALRVPLVNCFYTFVDASDLVKDAINLSNLFDEIVNCVGPAKYSTFGYGNLANYVAAGRILCGKYRNISWSPCAAHCLNLIFKEIGKMDLVAKLAKRASKITVFIYNHVALQAWLRTRKNWTEIVRPGPTRYAKDKKAKAVVKIILDNQFWNGCHVIVHIMSPLIRLLRIVDSDEKPAMGYVYDEIFIFAYWLNPAFQYDSSTLNKRLETQSAVTDVIESKVSVGRLKLVEELRLFREREQTFGTQLTQESAKTSQPDEWWKLFGSCAPTLQKFAIRILSQTAASSGCERNWSAFEQIHSKRRNRLEHQRLNDLVYVHYNYRLKERVKRKKFNFDPIDYASIDKTEFWVVEDEEPPFLDHEEIENALYEEGAHPIEEGSSSHVQRDDAPPGFRDKNHPIPIEDEENEDEDDDNDASGGAFGLHDDIDFNFLHNK